MEQMGDIGSANKLEGIGTQDSLGKLGLDNKLAGVDPGYAVTAENSGKPMVEDVAISLRAGVTVDGTVTGIKPFGAFVSLPTKEVGLVHISQVSKDYVENISDYLQIGQPIRVKVLSYEEVNGQKKIALSIRQADEPSPSGTSNLGGGNFGKQKSWGGKPGGLGKNGGRKSDNFEDKLAKFKKDSDEKMSSINHRLDGF